MGRDGLSFNWFVQQSLPSPRSLLFIASKSPSPLIKPFIGFGDPVLGRSTAKREPISSRGMFSSQRANPNKVASLPSLPETREEVLAIAKSLKADTESIFLGDRATETNVKSTQLENFRVVAFATHGVLSGELDGINDAGLILTPPAKASDIDDGVLTASEILPLRLNADWVILSACNTALGNGGPASEGLSGLARSFMFAGARSLLVSSWPVESQATTELTTSTISLYSGDQRTGKAEALRKSMIKMIHDSNTEYSHPYFWAPFFVVGSID